MSKKFFRNSLILIGIFIILFFNSIQIVTSEGIECDSNQYGSICVWPKISNNIIRQKQFYNVTSKITNTIDIAFRFNFSLSYGGLYYWNGMKYIKLNVQHIENNNYHYYVYQNFNVVNGSSYTGYWTYDVPINSEGKWDMYVKLSTDPIGTWRIHLDPWWDSDWSYYKTMYITNPLDDFQSMIQVDQDSGGDIDCGGHCKDDFSDIRFVYNNVTEIPYWIQNYTSGDQAYIWFNNTGNYSEIDIYYGNAGASLMADGYKTFYHFDDGDKFADVKDNWEVLNGNLYSYSATENYDFNTTKSIKLQHAGSRTNIRNSTWSLKNAIVFYAVYLDYGGFQNSIDDSGGNPICSLRLEDDNDLMYYDGGSYQDSGLDINDDGWHTLKIKLWQANDTVRLILDDTQFFADAHRQAFTDVSDYIIGTMISTNTIIYYDICFVANLTGGIVPSFSFGSESSQVMPPNLILSNVTPANNSYWCYDVTNLSSLSIHIENPYGTNFDVNITFLGNVYTWSNVGNGTFNVSLTNPDLFPILTTNYSWIVNVTARFCVPAGGSCYKNATYYFDICWGALNAFHIENLEQDIADNNVTSILGNLGLNETTIGLLLLIVLIFVAEWKEDAFYFLLVACLSLPLGVYLIVNETEMFDIFLGAGTVAVSIYSMFLFYVYALLWYKAKRFKNK